MLTLAFSLKYQCARVQPQSAAYMALDWKQACIKTMPGAALVCHFSYWWDMKYNAERPVWVINPLVWRLLWNLIDHTTFKSKAILKLLSFPLRVPLTWKVKAALLYFYYFVMSFKIFIGKHTYTVPDSQQYCSVIKLHFRFKFVLFVN